MKTIVASVVSILILASACAWALPRSGSVQFRGSGSPVPQAVIDFSSASQKARAITANDGSFYFPDLGDGSYHVTITYRGVRSEFDRVIPRDSMRFEIAP